MTKERPECLWYCEDELAMWKFEEDIVSQILSEEGCPFATAGERAKVIMSTLGVGTAYPRYALEIVAIGTGGGIPARILKTFISRPILTVGFSYYDENNQPKAVPEKIQWIDEVETKL